MKTVALALLLPAQDPASITEWVRQLDHDSVEVRAKAEEALANAGMGADRLLQEALRGATPEARFRIERILVEIDRREGYKRYDPGPASVTLPTGKSTLGGLLTEIRRRSGIPIKAQGLKEDDPVDLRGGTLTLYQALEGLCRAHGDIDWSVDVSRGSRPAVRVTGGKRARYPLEIRDGCFVRLISILSRRSINPEVGERKSWTLLNFRWGWEPGTRPSWADVRLEEVRDDVGTSYGKLFKEFRPKISGGELMMRRSPAARASRFTVMKGVLTLYFPASAKTVAFATPLEAPSSEEGRTGYYKLKECRREGGKVHATVGEYAFSFPEREDMILLGRRSARYPCTGVHYSRRSGQSTGTVHLEFAVPEGAEIIELRLRVPVGERARRIPFEFRDIPLR